jgi:hypothetical protein
MVWGRARRSVAARARHHARPPGPAASLVTCDTAGRRDYPARDLAACEAAIACVDSPMASDGSCDISHIRDAVERVPVSTVLIKSTVPPGTTDLLANLTGSQVCFSPSSLPSPLVAWTTSASGGATALEA